MDMLYNVIPALLLGTLLGLLSKKAGDGIIRVIMNRRGKTLIQSPGERVIAMAVMAAAGAVIMVYVPLSPETLYLFLLLITGEAITLIDIHHRIIPNVLVLAVLLVSLMFGIPFSCGFRGFPEFRLSSSLIGFAGCWVIFMTPAVLSRRIGAGDVKLAAAMGFCLGYRNALTAIVLMGLFMIAYILMQRKMPILSMIREMIPMGPFLAAAMVAVQLLEKIRGAT